MHSALVIRYLKLYPNFENRYLFIINQIGRDTHYSLYKLMVRVAREWSEIIFHRF